MDFYKKLFIKITSLKGNIENVTFLDKNILKSVKLNFNMIIISKIIFCPSRIITKCLRISLLKNVNFYTLFYNFDSSIFKCCLVKKK